MTRLTLSPTQLILGVSIFIIAFHNTYFWGLLSQRIELTDIKSLGLAASYSALLITLLSSLLFMISQRTLLKPILIICLMVSAVISYFSSLGVSFNDQMLLNIWETIKDQNHQEALELTSTSLIQSVVLLGVVPVLLVYWIPTQSLPWHQDQKHRLLMSLLLITLSTVLISTNYKQLSFFSRENRDLRLFTVPLYPTYALYRLVKQAYAEPLPFQPIGLDAHQTKPKTKRVGIVVVGETARADHFSLNGYAKNTNPLLAQQDIISFKNVLSCGTSTAYSVPCMFSFFDQSNYTPTKTAMTSNVLDVLQQANVAIWWRNNNSSCKGVCARVPNDDLRGNPDSGSPFYHQGEYFDEILVEGLTEYIDQQDSDILIVLHTLGSHGPAYYKRYPKSFTHFQPECRTSSPHECSNESLLNSYDNTIVYTDYLLNKVITKLQQHNHQYESFLLYVSDHGESLGENGIYLHGLPYLIAPKSQKHVPMLMWLSKSLKTSKPSLYPQLKQQQNDALSHDYL